ncbi:MAG: MgtC/SapB family protein [Clostridiales bacterium]|nr:MgtC/SapB family protein [Clostridiales bacterium]
MEWYTIVLRMAIALFIGAAIGIDREIRNRPAGLRTHALVCLGACTVALMESYMTWELDHGLHAGLQMNYGRLCAQVVSGVGFLGAGTIMSSKGRVRGLTTAASLWNAACLGIAAGYGYYLIAVVSVVCVILVLELLQKVVHIQVTKNLEVRFVHRKETMDFINEVFEKRNIKIINHDFSVSNATEEHQIYTSNLTISVPVSISESEVVGYLAEHKNVLTVRTSSFQS